MLRATGRDASKAFRHEAGGHRWQRVPPTDKRGRVHTSTVTVAVLREPAEAEIHLPDRDLVWRTCRSSGPGGQNVQKNDTAVQLTHKPSGITVRAETKSQHQNRVIALGILRARLLEAKQAEIGAKHNDHRRRQVGSGMRGDKRRTIALQRGQVTDHLTGKRMSAKKYLRGQIQDLWT